MRPSLRLDFANTRRIDPRITVSRASSGTYIDKLGLIRNAPANTARFNHDPVTRACKGVLIEEQRTNLLAYSSQLDNAAYGTKSNISVVPNQIELSISGVLGGLIKENSDVASVHYIEQATTIVSLGTYTASSFMKAGGRTKARLVLVIGGTSGVSLDVDLVAGTMGAAQTFGGATAVGAEIKPFPNGVYRVSVTGNGVGSTTGSWRIELLDAAGSRAYNGDGVSGVYADGAQLEPGAFPTSHIPTTSSQVTRISDKLSMTGNNFSSWYNQTEGTFIARFDYRALPSFARVFQADDGTENSKLAVGNTAAGTTRLFAYASSGGVSTVDTSAAPHDVVIGAQHAYGMAYANNGCAVAFAGSAVVTDTSVTLPTVTTLRIGSAVNGAQQICGHIASLVYYPTRLSNSQLQVLTES